MSEQGRVAKAIVRLAISTVIILFPWNCFYVSFFVVVFWPFAFGRWCRPGVGCADARRCDVSSANIVSGRPATLALLLLLPRSG